MNKIMSILFVLVATVIFGGMVVLSMLAGLAGVG